MHYMSLHATEDANVGPRPVLVTDGAGANLSAGHGHGHGAAARPVTGHGSGSAARPAGATVRVSAS